MKFNFTNFLKITLTGLFMLASVMTYAQQKQSDKGISKGVVKVKFKPTMTNTLRSVQISTKNNKLTTGISNFDKTAMSIKAFNMERLFPYDAQIESKLHKHGLDLWYIVKISDDVDPQAAVQALQQLSEVSIAEVDNEKVLPPSTYTYKTPMKSASSSALPFNDVMLGDQWHYSNTGQTGYANGADINLFKAWELTAGKNNIIVSIHDEGVDVNHVDLKDNIWVNTKEANGLPGVDDDGNGYIDDIYGYNFDMNNGGIEPQSHGTHVAGTIAAVNNNGIGVSGVAGGTGKNDGARIMSLQCMGGGSIERTYVYAAKMGAVISQNSWGYKSVGSKDQSVADAIKYFIAEAGDYEGSPLKGGIVIFAAGNYDSDAEWYPAYYDYVLSVTALAPDWKKAGYSCFGAWTDIAAPGGDANYGVKNQIMSTLPYNRYGYNQGTSMACPHVSGIAALAIANANHKMTNKELWNKLLSGTKEIDSYNPNYAGKLGTGAIDAFLAIQNDARIAPNKITDLSVKGFAQEFAILQWSVPSDQDDKQPYYFEIYYSTEPITQQNLSKANKLELKNVTEAGKKIEFEVKNLLGMSTYYFAVISSDRWDNKSELSNIATVRTANGPGINVNTGVENKSITMAIDANKNLFGNYPFKILNDSVGILRWNHFVRSRSTTFSTAMLENLKYPVAPASRSIDQLNTGSISLENNIPLVQKSVPTPYAFTTITKTYNGYNLIYIGDQDKSYPVSSATKFRANEAEGFNLTQVKFDLNFSAGNNRGTIIIEIYKGDKLDKNNLIVAQDYVPASNFEVGTVTVNLNEQLYFKNNEDFWVVIHAPVNNKYPLRIGIQKEVGQSYNCYYSTDLGLKWYLLSDILADNRIVWSTQAVSASPHVGTFITLDPVSGEVAGNTEADVTLKANASKLINGTYKANVILTSNDALNKEYRIPADLTVTNQKPNLIHPDVVDYGSVFLGSEKTIDILIENQGYGNIRNLKRTVNNTQFTIVSSPTNIPARDQATIRVKYTPTVAGNANGILTITNGTYTYTLSLFGVGSETSTIAIDPMRQTIDNLTIGDNASANIKVKNTGKYPLKYFVPGFDTQGVSNNWPTTFHKYGYAVRTSLDKNEPIPYEFNSIASTGIDITDYMRVNDYKGITFGFDFPYYGENRDSIFITKNGYTIFKPTARPVNNPSLGNKHEPKGCISPIGVAGLKYDRGGKIYYKVEADRLIIEYKGAEAAYAPNVYDVQMILFANGDIRFYYDKLPEESLRQYGAILIENIEQTDGIQLHMNGESFPYNEKTAVGFDYPGPNIIKAITNGSGILAPGAQSIIKVDLSTAAIPEGLTNRYISIVNNDPENLRISPLIELNVVAGGSKAIQVSRNEVDFGKLFKGEAYSQKFTIKNEGTKLITIKEISLSGKAFSVTGENIIKSGINEIYTITANTDELGNFNDEIVITLQDETVYKIKVVSEVIDLPIANADLTLIEKTLALGETVSVPFEVSNTGKTNLEVDFDNGLWYKFKEKQIEANAEYTYAIYKHNEGQPTYNWIDITKTGIHEPLAPMPSDSITYWHKIKNLNFPVKFFGVEYDSIKIGENGIIALSGNPMPMVHPEKLPISDNNAFIIPFLTKGFFDSLVDESLVGVFHQQFDDKIVVSWERFFNAFGSGSPISFQVVIYKDGTIKFQYKVNDNGMDRTSNTTEIALQKPGGELIMISERSFLTHGKGLAFLMAPKAKHNVLPNQKLEGDIMFDATNIYAGSFTDTLRVNTNDPKHRVLEKPLKLNISGKAVINLPDTIDFGRFVMKQLVDNIELPLNIKNEGNAIFEMSWAETGKKDQILTQLVLDTDPRLGKLWNPIEYVYVSFGSKPVMQVRPNEVLETKVRFKPKNPGKFEDVLTITTNAGVKKIVLIGEAFNPSVLGVDGIPVHVSINLPTQKETKSFEIDNKKGDYELNYGLSIKYNRAKEYSGVTSLAKAYSTSEHPNFILENISVSDAAPKTKAATLNRKLQYVSEAGINVKFGFGGSDNLSLATRFNGGEKGFNLTDVGTYFLREKSTSDILEVEVRAGGTSIYNAPVVGKGTLKYNETGEDPYGKMYNISLDNPVEIYPNEDFYVIVIYPLAIESPQGCVQRTSVETVEGRYLMYQNGEWYDVQKADGGAFKKGSWIMYAGEKTEKEIGWLKITSDMSGSILSGDSTAVNIAFDGNLAHQGTQYADIIISSNDRTNIDFAVPVSLHLNEAPYIDQLPSTIQVKEKEELILEYSVLDKEGDAITLNVVEKPSFVTEKFEDSKLKLVLNPDYGTFGLHNMKINVTDQYNASAIYNVSIDVQKTNRAPIFSGNETINISRPANSLLEYNINTLFSDPDNDKLSFEFSSSNENILVAYKASNDIFILKPIATGTVQLNFTVSDNHGASVTKTINVTITNNAPVYIGEDAAITLPLNIGFKEYNINDLFSDTDGDKLSFEVTNSDNKILTVNKFGESIFKLNLLAKGSTQLNLTVSDSYGASVTKTIDVTVTNNAPIYIGEDAAITLPLNIGSKEYNINDLFSDADGDKLSFEITNSDNKILTVNKVGESIFKLNLLAKGSSQLNLTVSDSYGASVTKTIDVTVTNNAPIYVGNPDATIFLSQDDESTGYNIYEFFADADDDKLTFNIINSNEKVVLVTKLDSENFQLEGLSGGSAQLMFTVSDGFNPAIIKTITVEVCATPASIIIQKWNNTLLVNNKEGKYKEYQWYKNGQPIAGAVNQYYTTDNNDLDFTAQYHVVLTTTNGTALATCPMTPTKKGISLRAYPNPVKAGATLKVEAELPDIATDKVTIQVISMTGQIISTIVSDNSSTPVQMPNAAGAYLVKVQSGSISQVFNIIVE